MAQTIGRNAALYRVEQIQAEIALLNGLIQQIGGEDAAQGRMPLGDATPLDRPVVLTLSTRGELRAAHSAIVLYHNQWISALSKARAYRS